MSDVLSPEQIAALFAAHDEGQLGADGSARLARRPARVHSFDFNRPNKFTMEQERQLRRAHETFCRTAASRLSSELRTLFDLELIGAKQVTWTTAIGDIVRNSLCAVVGVEPIERRMLIVIERKLMLTLIERLLGGDVERVPRDRRLTDIDVALSRQIMGNLLEQLSLVWQDLGDVRLGFLDFEPEPGSAQIAPLSEPTMVVTIEARLGKSSFIISLLVPYRCIEPISSRMPSIRDGLEGYDERSARLMQAALGDSTIELRAEVASVDLAAEEVVGLQVGDVLRLDSRRCPEVTLYAGDVPVHHGRPGRYARRRAVQVTGSAEE